MILNVLKSKIHKAIITNTNINYEGSITIDKLLMEKANILENEQVHIWDITNGSRIITYAISGEAGSGEICINGAGARLLMKGDQIIIATFALMNEDEAKKYKPIVILVDKNNNVIK